MTAKQASLIALAVLLVGNAGCLLPFGPDDVRWQLNRQADIRTKPVLTLTTDGLSLATLASLLPAPLPIPVSHILWLQFGMYRMEAASADLGELELGGWERMVRTREDGNEVLVFVNPGLRGMIVLIRDGEELMIVKLVGRIDRLLEAALDQFGPGGMTNLFGGCHGAGTPAPQSAEPTSPG